MEENEININDINKKLDDIIIKNKLLEKENKEFKERFLKAENTIHNLNIQLNFLRKEYKMIIFEFKKQYARQISLIFELISQNNEKNKDKNEIIIDIKEKKKEKKENKSEDSKSHFFNFFKQKKEKKKEEKTKNKNNITTLDKFDELLSNIFSDESQQISEEHMDEFKKLSKVLLIERWDLQKATQIFFDVNFNKFTEQLNEQEKTNISNKKLNLFLTMDKVSLNGIEYKDDLDFRKKFRTKFGITEKDINDQELDQVIKKNNKDENKIIQKVLKKINYIK